MTIQDLVENGYVFVPGEYAEEMHFADSLYQRCVRGEDNTKLYFINVFVYDWSRLSKGFKQGFGFMAEVHFYSRRTDSTHYDFRVTFPYDGETVQEMEQFFSDMYSKMSCVPDIHNN